MKVVRLSKTFYVVLLRNEFQGVYQDNTTGSLSVEMARLIVLGPKDKWEVASCELS